MRPQRMITKERIREMKGTRLTIEDRIRDIQLSGDDDQWPLVKLNNVAQNAWQTTNVKTKTNLAKD